MWPIGASCSWFIVSILHCYIMWFLVLPATVTGVGVRIVRILSQRILNVFGPGLQCLFIYTSLPACGPNLGPCIQVFMMFALILGGVMILDFRGVSGVPPPPDDCFMYPHVLFLVSTCEMRLGTDFH